jgi:hypothetical protein
MLENKKGEIDYHYGGIVPQLKSKNVSLAHQVWQQR